MKKYAKSLETLKLAQNKITSFKDVEELACLKNLKNLDLENNEVTKIDGYKEKMWALFKDSALEILDNHNKEGEEAFSEDLDDYGSSLDNANGEQGFIEGEDIYGDEGFEGGEDDMDDLEGDESEDQAQEANKRAKH